MSNEIFIGPIIGAIIGAIIGFILSFNVKNYLQKKADYEKLKEITHYEAGKGGKIVYNSDIYIIEKIDNRGITIEKDDFQKIFIPTKKIIENDIIIPLKEYKKIKKEKEEEEKRRTADIIWGQLVKLVEQKKL